MPTTSSSSSGEIRSRRVAGAWYLGLAVCGIFGFLLLRPELLVPGDAAGTAANLVARETLARLAIAFELGIVLTQALTAAWFYRVFREVDSFAAGLTAAFGLVNAVVVLISAGLMTTALSVARAPAAGGDTGAAHLLLQISGELWFVGAIFFGLWLLPMARLVLRCGWLPRPLGWVLAAGGVGYLLQVFLGALLPGAQPLLDLLPLPAGVGEFWMIGCLLLGGRRRRDTAPVLPVAAALVLILGAAVAGCHRPGDPAPGRRGEEALPATEPAPEDVDVLAALAALEADFGGRIGAFGLDVDSGAVLGHRAGERFGMASSFKAALCAAVLDRARRLEPELLDRRLQWRREHLIPHSPVTAAHVEDGLTVTELCAATITTSDNTAANLLLGVLGGPTELTGFLRSIGDGTTRLDRYEPEMNDWRPGEVRDTTTPEAMGRTLAAVTLGEALEPADRAQMLAWLRGTVTGAARIRAGLPEGWILGHKTGTPGVYGGAHDIAVAWPPLGGPLILVVYTDRADPEAEPEESVLAEAATLLARGLGRL